MSEESDQFGASDYDGAGDGPNHCGNAAAVTFSGFEEFDSRGNMFDLYFETLDFTGLAIAK